MSIALVPGWAVSREPLRFDVNSRRLTVLMKPTAWLCLWVGLHILNVELSHKVSSQTTQPESVLRHLIRSDYKPLGPSFVIKCTARCPRQSGHFELMEGNVLAAPATTGMADLHLRVLGRVAVLGLPLYLQAVMLGFGSPIVP